MGGMFSTCVKLANIPANLFDENILCEDFNQLCNYCLALTGLPAALFVNNPLVSNYKSVFAQCEGLLTIPADLFGTNTAVGVDMGYAFVDCPALTAIPDILFDGFTNITKFDRCFSLYASPGSLTGTALPTLWIDWPAATHTQCFKNHTEATNYNAASAAGWA
jgi:hypothetical protein